LLYELLQSDESDLDPAASGYTADLLLRLQARSPAGRLASIVGGDSLLRSRRRGLDEVQSSGCRTMILYSICSSALNRSRV
jgi:hypothetical protein